MTHHSSTKPIKQADQKPVNSEKGGLFKFLRITWNFLFNKPRNTQPKRPIPVKSITQMELQDAPDNTVFRLGHSTILLKLQNEFWLTDPVFSERASPLQWAGPKRFHQPPISIEELPPIKGVILSHDHYDHLDRAAILKLAEKTAHFIAPLGVGDRLIKWGISKDKVQQLDWWQSTQIDTIELVATPAQHFSGRTLFDSNTTLWASWVINTGNSRVFFSGDSGYFSGFKLIGEKYGPFDLTLMETGAYDANWPDVHMQPEQSLQAHIDLKGRWLMPIHNGTFDLAMHAWYDPFERIVSLAKANGIQISTPYIGQAVEISNPHPGQLWWRSVETNDAHLFSQRNPSAINSFTSSSIKSDISHSH